MKPAIHLLFKEITQPIHYIVAAAVGLLFTFFGTQGIQSPVIPFFVPFFVSLSGRFLSRLKTMKQDYLLELPALRKSPVFVMEKDGSIAAASGRTESLFESLSVNRIQDLLPDLDTAAAVDHMLSVGDQTLPEPLHAPAEDKWYRVQTHAVLSREQILVWLDDVTEEYHTTSRRVILRSFQNALLDSFRDTFAIEDADARLAELVLEGGYASVLFARGASGGTVTGFVYKNDEAGTLVRSEKITIEPKTQAPVFLSRQKNRAVCAQAHDYPGPTAFYQAFPVTPEVRDFISSPIENLVTYHAEATSVVAFNKPSGIGQADLSFIESAVDAAHGMFTVIDAARDRDTRFIQSIHGLCASAEFSDEITGAHIWRVNLYARELATYLSADATFRRDISQVAATHDIGKVAMPELIQMPGIFSPEERMRMQMHTVYGAQILDRMIEVGENPDPRLCMAREIALNHHQRWDGRGYPGLKTSDGSLITLHSREQSVYSHLLPLKGDEISLAARIVSACDSYDALRSERPYKPGLTHEATVRLMSLDDRSGARGEDRFGPDVFDAFMETRHILDGIYTNVQHN